MNKKSEKKATNKKVAIMAAALCALTLFLLGAAKKAENAELTIEGWAKNGNILLSVDDSAELRAKEYARNCMINIVNGSQIVLENAIDETVTVTVNGNTAVAEANGVTLAIDNLKDGEVNVEASLGTQAILIKFTAGETAGEVSGTDYKSTARANRNSIESTHYDVYDENGNVIGSVLKQEVLGTTEGEKAFEEAGGYYVETQLNEETPVMDAKGEDKSLELEEDYIPVGEEQDVISVNEVTEYAVEQSGNTLSTEYASINIIDSEGNYIGSLMGAGASTIILQENEISWNTIQENLVESTYGIFYYYAA